MQVTPPVATQLFPLNTNPSGHLHSPLEELDEDDEPPEEDEVQFVHMHVEVLIPMQLFTRQSAIVNPQPELELELDEELEVGAQKAVPKCISSVDGS